MSERNDKGNGAPATIPVEAFNTPELRRALAEALAKEGAKSPEFQKELIKATRAQILSKQPRFWEALKADTEFFWASRGEPRKLESTLDVVKGAFELVAKSDCFLGLALYRARMRLMVRQVPVLPNLLHRICMACFQISIGDHVVIEPGVYIPHGQVVIDGAVEIGRGTVLTPWITIGLIDGRFDAPKIGRNVLVGTGSSILGPVTIGMNAKIGSRAVVVKDVPPNTTVVGVPAAPLRKGAPKPSPDAGGAEPAEPKKT